MAFTPHIGKKRRQVRHAALNTLYRFLLFSFNSPTSSTGNHRAPTAGMRTRAAREKHFRIDFGCESHRAKHGREMRDPCRMCGAERRYCAFRPVGSHPAGIFRIGSPVSGMHA
ncbi:hypothetical protein [Burkholderia sp. BCC1998]|uniref:hypothetical protein n=1 Tax=Burkholderia sp. BCC1998 TaxID=2817447 RepID=UPI002AB7376D|nr:hypothetical protein [Burkholderia sp. BCC1998]